MGVKKLVNGGGLGKVDSEGVGVGVCPMVVGAKEPGEVTLKVNADLGLEGGFKPVLDILTDRIVSKVIEVASNIDGGWPGRGVPTKREGC